MDLTRPLVTDRAIGALLGLACGDALGAGYEFGGALDHDPEMIGGGAFDWEPGEWTDDTQMAICIAEVTARGQVDAEAVGERFLDWFRAQPKDVGASTGAVLGTARVGADLPSAARAYFEANPEGAAGNGSLMRTAPVALATLGQDPRTVAATARAISDLTHGDPLAGDGCVLWCLGMDHAIREGSFDGVRAGLDRLPSQRRDRWRKWLDEAETSSPAAFTGNGFVARALQAAWASIVQTPVPDDAPACLHLQHALRTAVRIGDDTDTVGAIAGQLLGARWGASAIPFAWRRVLHGWPGYRAGDLVRLAVLSARNGESDTQGWPSAPRMSAHGERGWTTELPDDPGVLLGNLVALDDLPDVDAVVSLCRVGTEQVPSDVEHHEVLLIDQEDANPNLGFVLTDAADAIATLRDEGKRVLVHCVGGRSRTPAVAASYLVRRFGIDGQDALRRAAAAVPEDDPHNRDLRRAVLGSAADVDDPSPRRG